MEKIKSLNCYQKGVLISMITMTLVFAVVYHMTISKVGFKYKDTILLPSQENVSTLYSGKIQGQQAYFKVSEDKTIVFQHGDKTYGPYTAKEDPTAVPKDQEIAEHMTGVEIRQGEDILFRGGVLEVGDSYLMYNEDGSLDNFRFPYTSTSGDRMERDENVIAVDPLEPSVSTILELMNDPKLSHKGEWFPFFVAMFICFLNALSILFVEELFRWDLAFKIRNVDHAQPSDWEIAGRYMGWTVATIMALVLFITGLQ